MADITVPYGQPYQPAVTGAPEGAEITYTYSRDGQPLVEAPVLPGEYTVEATVTAAGYETATLSAALTITALTFEGLSMADITVSYGQSYQPAVTGLESYPEATVEYSYARGG